MPFAALATAIALPVPAALAVPQALPEGGTVVATTEDQTTAIGAPILPPLPLPATTPLAAHAAGCPHAHSRPSRLKPRAARAALLCAVNRARARHGLPGLGGERHLRRAATGQARDMVRHGYFAHQRPGGPSLGDRLRAAGWHGRSAGEAIAWGCGSAASAGATVQAWLHSPPHREILLSGAYDRAGVGVAKRAPASCGPGATWVLDTGGR